jgi:hypothetical protein
VNRGVDVGGGRIMKKKTSVMTVQDAQMAAMLFGK